MVDKCSNHSCSASFRSLNEGRLFPVESDPAIRSSDSTRMEYFWLCHCCSSTITLRLKEDGTMVTTLLSESIRGVPDDVAITVVDRQKGLLLRSISFPCRALRKSLRKSLKRAAPENGAHALVQFMASRRVCEKSAEGESELPIHNQT